MKRSAAAGSAELKTLGAPAWCGLVLVLRDHRPGRWVTIVRLALSDTVLIAW